MKLKKIAAVCGLLAALTVTVSPPLEMLQADREAIVQTTFEDPEAKTDAFAKNPGGYIRYKGGTYSIDGSILFDWSLEEAMKDGCEFEAIPDLLLIHRSYFVPADTFHPNLKILAENSLHEIDALIAVPWGVTTVEKGAIYDTACYLPPTAVYISKDSFIETRTSEVVCETSQAIYERTDYTGMSLAFQSLPRWYEIYESPPEGWMEINGRLYYFVLDHGHSDSEIAQMATGILNIGNVNYCFAETGPLIWADLEEDGICWEMRRFMSAAAVSSEKIRIKR